MRVNPEWSADVRLGAHSGRKSDMAPCPKSAKSGNGFLGSHGVIGETKTLRRYLSSLRYAGETKALRKSVFDPLVAKVRISLPKRNRIAGH